MKEKRRKRKKTQKKIDVKEKRRERKKMQKKKDVKEKRRKRKKTRKKKDTKGLIRILLWVNCLHMHKYADCRGVQQAGS